MNIGVFGFSAGKDSQYIEYLEKFHIGASISDNSFIEYSDIYTPCDVAVIFGSCRYDKLKPGRITHHSHKAKIIDEHKGKLVYIESCLLGRTARVDANKHWRVGINHFMFKDGEFGFRDNPPSDRFEINLL